MPNLTLIEPTPYTLYPIPYTPYSITYAILTQSELLQGPKVFLNKVPVGKINELSKIVVDHGGAIVSSEEAASHVIDWNEEVDGAYNGVDDYIRILELKSTSGGAGGAGAGVTEGANAHVASALVHWWYYPDSYNEWIPSSEINANDPPDLQSLYPPTRSKYYVCCRYVLDCAAFNEWGNSFDYENENEYIDEMDVVEEEKTGAVGVATKKRGRKRFSQIASTKEKEKVVTVSIVVGSVAGVEKLLPDAIPKSLTSSVKTMEVGPTGAELRGASGTGASGTTGIAGVKRRLEDMKEEGSAWARPDWYLNDRVSTYEARLLGATVQEASEYLKLRNAIVAICRQSPLNYISGTDARRKLPGDVSKILKIHNFLSSSNVINQGAQREARTDPPSLFLSGSASGSAGSTEDRGVSMAVDSTWSTSWDDSLLALAAKHQHDHNIDWVALAAEPELQAKYSAADCAARFITLQLPSMPGSMPSVFGGSVGSVGCEVPGASGASGAGARGEQSWVSTLSEALALISRVSSPLYRTSDWYCCTSFSNPSNFILHISHFMFHISQSSTGQTPALESAVLFTLRETVAAQLQRSNTDSHLLSSKYLQTKLDVLAGKVKLLEQVEEAQAVERERLEAEKMELQVLRAQLALAQQSRGHSNQ
jgi:hypothetical protein